MDEQTTTITKTELTGEKPPEQLVDNESKIGSITVRSLIALILVSTVCIMCASQCIVDMIVSFNSKSLATNSIPEPLYSGFMVAIGAYLGKQMASKVNGVK